MNSSYVPAYDGLRFLLLLGVLEFHYCIHAVPIQQIWFLSYCLPCFFVLSGFLITQVLVRAGGSWWEILKEFYLRRALRIFPAYYVVLVCAFLVYRIPYLEWHLTYLFNLKLFAGSLAPPTPDVLAFMSHWDTNGLHLWSMGVEEQFYVLFPPLLLLTSERWRTAWLITGILISIALRLWLSQAFPASSYGALLPVAGEYILWGCLFAWLDHRAQPQWMRKPALLLISLAGLVVLFLCESGLERYSLGQMAPPPQQTLYAACLAGFIVALKYQGATGLARWMGWKPLAQLGKISYGTYLVHPFLNPLVDRILSGFPGLIIWPAAPRAVLGPALSLVVAGLMWVTFEHRVNRIKRRPVE